MNMNREYDKTDYKPKTVWLITVDGKTAEITHEEIASQTVAEAVRLGKIVSCDKVIRQYCEFCQRVTFHDGPFCRNCNCKPIERTL